LQERRRETIERVHIDEHCTYLFWTNGYTFGQGELREPLSAPMLDEDQARFRRTAWKSSSRFRSTPVGAERRDRLGRH
jgi:hypothetical protein